MLNKINDFNLNPTMFKKFSLNLENKLKMMNKNYKYIPKLPFKGMQECFTKIELDDNTTEL